MWYRDIFPPPKLKKSSSRCVECRYSLPYTRPHPIFPRKTEFLAKFVPVSRPNKHTHKSLVTSLKFHHNYFLYKANKLQKKIIILEPLSYLLTHKNWESNWIKTSVPHFPIKCEANIVLRNSVIILND